MKTTICRKPSFIGILSLVAGGLLQGSTLYTLADLGPADNVRSLNDKGQVLGRSNGGSFFYDGSTRYALPSPMNGSFSGAGLNNEGEIAGTLLKPGYDYSLAAYSNGAFQSLGGSPNASATAINDAGQIAGDQVRAYQAFLYSGGTFTNIGTLPGDVESAARAIAPDGSVLAVSIGATGLSYHPVIFSNGTLTPVPGSTGLSSEVSGINSEGQVVGSAFIVSGNAAGEAVLFSGGQAHLLGFFPGPGVSESFANAINDSGVIVGGNLNSIYPRAFVDYSGTGLVDLNSLLTNGTGWVLENANAVNNDGQIAGTGLYQGRNEAFLLTPVTTPEPNSLALAALGLTVLSGFFGCARRQSMMKRDTGLVFLRGTKGKSDTRLRNPEESDPVAIPIGRRHLLWNIQISSQKNRRQARNSSTEKGPWRAALSSRPRNCPRIHGCGRRLVLLGHR